jgi:hypothetical protein
VIFQGLKWKGGEGGCLNPQDPNYVGTHILHPLQIHDGKTAKRFIIAIERCVQLVHTFLRACYCRSFSLVC